MPGSENDATGARDGRVRPPARASDSGDVPFTPVKRPVTRSIPVTPAPTKQKATRPAVARQPAAAPEEPARPVSNGAAKRAAARAAPTPASGTGRKPAIRKSAARQPTVRPPTARAGAIEASDTEKPAARERTAGTPSAQKQPGARKPSARKPSTRKPTAQPTIEPTGETTTEPTGERPAEPSARDSSGRATAQERRGSTTSRPEQSASSGQETGPVEGNATGQVERLLRVQRPGSRRPAPRSPRAGRSSAAGGSATAVATRVRTRHGERIEVGVAQTASASWLRSVRLSGFSILVLGLIVMFLVVLAPSLKVLLEQRQQISDLQAAVEAQKDQMTDLTTQRARWDDPSYIRAQARDRLFYVMPGEYSYLIIDDTAPAATDSADATDAAQAAATVDWASTLWSSFLLAGLTTDADPTTAGG